MKKIYLTLTLLLVSITLTAQDLNGVWMATDNKARNLATTNAHDMGVIFLDFDQRLIGNMTTISEEPISLNRKGNKIKATGIKGKLKVESHSENQLVLKGSKGVRSGFTKLDLSHTINMEPSYLKNHLINQYCGGIEGIQGKFTTERFFKDQPDAKRLQRNQFINFTDRKNGYWYFKNIRGNAFLVFTVDDSSSENIFQVLSIRLRGFDVLQLQDDNRITNVSLLETCL